MRELWNIHKQMIKQQVNLEKSNIENEAYRRRIKYLERMAESTDTVKRPGWRANLSQLPDWKLKKKGRGEKRKKGDDSSGNLYKEMERRCEPRVQPHRTNPVRRLGAWTSYWSRIGQHCQPEEIPDWEDFKSDPEKEEEEEEGWSQRNRLMTDPDVARLLFMDNNEYLGKVHSDSDVDLKIQFNEQLEI